MPRIFHVDAFTSTPFAGNPAAVCLLEEIADATWMQEVAMEMNLSETAFTYPSEDHFRLRWFTPTVEVELCGHATLATAHILWETGTLPPNESAVFQTLSGELSAKRSADRIELDFPATPPESHSPTDGMLQALGVEPKYVGRNKFDFLVEVETPEMVRGLEPDFGVLRSLGVRGVIVTSRDRSGEFDFVSRYFAPGAGIDEDPVTGSAHCTLGPYWQQRLDKDRMQAFQASRRGGRVEVHVDGERVKLLGHAVTVLAGELKA